MSRADALAFLSSRDSIVGFVESQSDACESAFYSSDDALQMNNEQAIRVVESGTGLVAWVENELNKANGDFALWNAWANYIYSLRSSGAIQ